jgi:hypothetical protein
MATMSTTTAETGDNQIILQSWMQFGLQQLGRQKMMAIKSVCSGISQRRQQWQQR